MGSLNPVGKQHRSGSARKPAFSKMLLSISKSRPARVLFALLILSGFLSEFAFAVSTTLVISEFRTRGPNGAYDEFVELFNFSPNPVNIGGWRVSGSSNTGTTAVRA